MAHDLVTTRTRDNTAKNTSTTLTSNRSRIPLSIQASLVLPSAFPQPAFRTTKAAKKKARSIPRPSTPTLRRPEKRRIEIDAKSTALKQPPIWGRLSPSRLSRRCVQVRMCRWRSTAPAGPCVLAMLAECTKKLVNFTTSWLMHCRVASRLPRAVVTSA